MIEKITKSDLRLLAEKKALENPLLISDETADLNTLVHELHTHQIELEMQNDELMRAQLEITESRDRYSYLYDDAPIGYVTVDPQGLIIEANLTVAKLLGTERGQLLKRPLTNFITPENQDIYYWKRREMLGQGKQQAFDLQMKRGNRNQFWARLEGMVSRRQGCPDELRLAISDVSEYHQMANALRASEALHRDLYDGAPNAYFTVSAKDGRISNCNKAACQLLDYSRQELSSMVVFELYANSPDGVNKAREVYQHFKAGNTIT